MRNDRCRFWLWLWPFPWTVHEREHCNRVTLVTQHLDNRCNLRTLIKSTSGTRSEEDGSKEATGLKGSLSVGCCIKLKLANQTRYRCNLIVILIKIGQDRSKCESSEGVKRVGKVWTWPASFVRYSLFFFFCIARENFMQIVVVAGQEAEFYHGVLKPVKDWWNGIRNSIRGRYFYGWT